MSETAVSTPIWDFVLNYYGRKGVSDALIGLQDNHGIDVNMLLFLMWMAAQSKSRCGGRRQVREHDVAGVAARRRGADPRRAPVAQGECAAGAG